MEVEQRRSGNSDYTTSVGLAQARPNYTFKKSLSQIWVLCVLQMIKNIISACISTNSRCTTRWQSQHTENADTGNFPVNPIWVKFEPKVATSTYTVACRTPGILVLMELDQAEEYRHHVVSWQILTTCWIHVRLHTVTSVALWWLP